MLANIVDDPVSFAVRSDGPSRSLQDLIGLGKSKPGGLSVGTTGIGSDDHFLTIMFQHATGTPVMHAPFKGSTEIIAALRGGVIDVAAINVSRLLSGSQGN